MEYFKDISFVKMFPCPSSMSCSHWVGFFLRGDYEEPHKTTTMQGQEDG